MGFEFVCSDCDATYDSEEKDLMVCPVCSQSQRPHEPLKGILLINLHEDHHANRFDASQLMPIDRTYWPDINAGPTPLHTVSRLRHELVLDQLFVKNDGVSLTGSFKDRASLLVAARAREIGCKEIVLASTGNAGSSMAGIGAASSLHVTLFLPAAAPRAKLIQSLQYGARVVLVDGNYDRAYDLSLEYSQKRGGMNRNTGYNPFTIEGKKSVVLELFQQLGTLPDVIFVPVGDGCILAGVFKGIADLHRFGFCRKQVKVIGVQSEKSAALTRAFESPIGTFPKITATTLADSISVDVPRVGSLALKYLSNFDGDMMTVSEDEILEAQTRLAASTGIFAEPAAAIVYAGLIARRPSLSRDDRIVLLATGNGLKDVENASKIMPSLPRPIRSLEELS
jgi:threonine synthase